MGVSGHFVSDCWALLDFHLNHKVTKMLRRLSLCLHHGCDLGVIMFLVRFRAIARGLITEPMWNVRSSAHSAPDSNSVCSIRPKMCLLIHLHRCGGLRCASSTGISHCSRSGGMLKNKDNILRSNLPRKKFLSRVPPHQHGSAAGNYYGFNNQMVTLLEGLTGRIPEGMGIEYTSGAMLKHPREIKDTWRRAWPNLPTLQSSVPATLRSLKARRASHCFLLRTVIVKVFPC